jgi:hypothetical protein
MVTWDDLEPTSPLAIYDKGALPDPHYNDGDFPRLSIWERDIVFPKVEQEEPLRAQNRHFLEAIAGATLRSTGQFAAGVVRTLQATAKSLKRGGAPVLVDAPAAASGSHSNQDGRVADPFPANGSPQNQELIG